MTFPKPTELAILTVNGFHYQDWLTVSVVQTHHDWPLYQAVFTTSEDAPNSKSFAAMRIKPGDFCTVTLAGELAFTGKVSIREVYADATRHGVKITAICKNELVTGSVIHPTMEWKEKTFEQIARPLLQKMGINLKFEGGAPPSYKFPRISATPGEAVFDFLDMISRGLGAGGIGLAFTQNAAGDFVVAMGPIGGSDEIVEGKNGLILREFIYDLEAAGNNPSLSQGPGSDDKSGADVASVPFFNEQLQSPFGKNFAPTTIFNEIASSDIKLLQGRVSNQGMWQQSSQIIVTATSQGWLRPSGGGIWKRGQDVIVTSPMLIMDKQKLTAKTIEFTQDNTSGTRTTLTLCNPLALGSGSPALNSGG